MGTIKVTAAGLKKAKVTVEYDHLEIDLPAQVVRFLSGEHCVATLPTHRMLGADVLHIAGLRGILDMEFF